MPVWSPPLAALTREGRLPPAVYLLIDAIDNQRRGVELPCHRDFWLAVQEELLPLVHGYAPFSDRPDRTVVAGQSFGGLAAMFAALNWPQRFGCVLSQSGSYWWPHRDGRGTGFIGEQLRQVRCPRPGCASGWKRANANRSFFARTGRYWRNSPQHSRRFSGVRLTAGMMRFAGAAG